MQMFRLSMLLDVSIWRHVGCGGAHGDYHVIATWMLCSCVAVAISTNQRKRGAAGCGQWEEGPLLLFA